MCGRFAQRLLFPPGLQAVVDLKHDLREVPARFNLAATQLASVILDRRTGRQMSRIAWGLLPHWAKA